MYSRVVFRRLQMGEYFRRHAEFLRQTFFQQRRQSMGLADGHQVRKQQMDLDDLSVSRCAVAHTVILQTQFTADDIQLATDFPSNTRVRMVEQSYSRAPYQVPASPQNVDRHRNRQQGIERLPLRQHHQDKASHHAETGPTVGEHVLAVRLQDERLAAPPCAYQVPTQSGVKHTRQQHQECARSQVLQLQAGHPFLDGGVQDEDG